MVTKQKPPIKEANVVLLLSRYKYTNNSNKYMKIIKDWSPVVALVAIFLLLMNLRGRHREPKPINQINLKPELKAQDSFRTVIKYIEKERLVEVVKWQKTKEKALRDSTPCGTEIRFIVQQADTVIKIDSILIVTLKNQHNNDTVIQVKQADIIQQKTDSIKTLSKKLKWSKLKTKGVIALWVIREAVGLLIKSKINPIL